MSTPSIVVDGLWRCLCPSYRPRLGSVTSRLIRDALHSPTVVARYSTSYSRGAAFLNPPPNRPHLSRKTQPYSRTVISSFNSLQYGSPDTAAIAQDAATLDLPTQYEKLRQLAKAGHFTYVENEVNRLVRRYHVKPNLELYNSLILANINPQHGSARRVAGLLAELQEEGLDADAQTCHDALKVLAVHPDYILRIEILEYMRQRWLSLTAEGHHSVTAALVKEKAYEMALERMELMNSEGIMIEGWLYDMVYFVLAETGNVKEAFYVLRMREARRNDDIPGIVWSHLLDNSSRALEYDATEYVWKRRVEPGYVNPSSGTCLNVLHTAARHGDTLLATDVFRVLAARKTIFDWQHYEMLLQAYLQINDLKTAISVYQVMLDAGIELDDGAMRPLFRYLAEQNERPTEAFQTLRSLRETGQKAMLRVANCLMDASIQLGNLEEAVEQYKELDMVCGSPPDVDTFNVLLRGCVLAKKKELGMYLATEMLAINVQPNRRTYDRLISLCLKVGDYGDAYKYFEEMKSLEWRPSRDTMSALIGALVDAGDRRADGLLVESKKKKSSTVEFGQVQPGEGSQDEAETARQQ